AVTDIGTATAPAIATVSSSTASASLATVSIATELTTASGDTVAVDFELHSRIMGLAIVHQQMQDSTVADSSAREAAVIVRCAVVAMSVIVALNCCVIVCGSVVRDVVDESADAPDVVFRFIVVPGIVSRFVVTPVVVSGCVAALVVGGSVVDLVVVSGSVVVLVVVSGSVVVLVVASGSVVDLVVVSGFVVVLVSVSGSVVVLVVASGSVVVLVVASGSVDVLVVASGSVVDLVVDSGSVVVLVVVSGSVVVLVVDSGSVVVLVVVSGSVVVLVVASGSVVVLVVASGSVVVLVVASGSVVDLVVDSGSVVVLVVVSGFVVVLVVVSGSVVVLVVVSGCCGWEAALIADQRLHSQIVSRHSVGIRAGAGASGSRVQLGYGLQLGVQELLALNLFNSGCGGGSLRSGGGSGGLLLLLLLSGGSKAAGTGAGEAMTFLEPGLSRFHTARRPTATGQLPKMATDDATASGCRQPLRQLNGLELQLRRPTDWHQIELSRSLRSTTACSFTRAMAASESMSDSASSACLATSFWISCSSSSGSTMISSLPAVAALAAAGAEAARLPVPPELTQMPIADFIRTSPGEQPRRIVHVIRIVNRGPAAMADEAGPSEKAKFTKDTEEVDIDPISGKRRVEGGGGRQGRRLTLFDRSSGSVLNPCFASSVLEAHYQRISYQQSVGRLRCACAYLALCSLVWLIYFAIRQTPMWWGLVLTEVATILVFVLLLGATYVRALFPRFSLVLSLIAVVVKGGLLLANMAALKGDEDYGYLPIFDFAGVLQVVMVSYTLIPIPLYLCLLYGILLSGLYILCLVFFIGVETPLILTSHAVMLIGVQIVGFQLHIMSQVRRRSTYLRLCEGARLKRDQAHEKESKDAMIKSLMPESVAKAITETGEGGTENGPSGGPGKSDAKFRKFYVKQLQDVSVLFADIVGFTNMSSGKTAPHLVYLLNDLFGRFDDLCDKSGCEKIATLGDCYYCVAGCPEPKPDHAECCVEMGRAMVEAIREFDRDHEEAVNMRVGVHTGTVTCGIVGKMRFKFDVWSNDVTLANEMESSGQPGRVHISDDTYNFVKDIYKLDEGPVVPDIRELKVLIEYYDETKKGYAIKHTQNEKTIKTYFVVERVDGRPHISLPKQDDVVVEVTGPSASGPTDQELTGMIGTDDSNLKAFYSPPVSQITLNFRQGSLESSYRRYGVLPDATDSKDAPAALSNPRLAMLLFVAAAGFLAAPAAAAGEAWRDAGVN
uniref:adenylate cyclase n=1 Tax=Macrostomum lignano TaxID=282301 RepID=A0A1I8INA2_9PLAT